MTDPIIVISEQHGRWHRPLFLAITAVVVVGIIALAHAVMLPFVLALVIAYLLTPLVAWVERARLPRPAAIILVYVVVLGLLGTFIRLTAPRLSSELANLRRELPAIVHQAQDVVTEGQARLRRAGLMPAPAAPDSGGPPEPAVVVHPRPDGTYAVEVGSGLALHPAREGGFIVEPVREQKTEPLDLNRTLNEAIGKSFAYAQRNALELARIGRDIVASISRVIFIFFITLMLAAYIMLTRERILWFFASLVRPSSRPSFSALLKRIDRGLSGVVRGQLLICLVNGVLSAIGFAIVGLKYWPVLAIIATVLSLIPIFGSIISSVPAVALALTQSFGTAVFVLLWIIGIHQLEANLLNPKIMGDQARLHPVLVVFSLLVGEHFFHTMGALLAVPCMSIAQNLFIHFRQIVQSRDPELAGEPVSSVMPPPPNW